MISMRRMRRVFGVTMALMFILGFIASAPPWAHAQIPRYINYQGKLTDAEDNPVTGDVGITLRIYDAETDGTALWTEMQTATVTRGIFSILLGNTTALDDLDFNSAYWYSVEIESDGEMTPRQRLTAVAYAINADKLDGYDAADFLTVDTSEGSNTGITVEGGLITAGANEDIELNPTGTGNVIITIDSTSGDFKITDGTTNFVVVDNATGNVTVANDLTVSGIIYGVLASTGGDSTFSSIVVTGTSDFQGNISDSGGALTIADALTQTGSTNQVTFAGNVDATNGVDVTGALTVSGAMTLSSALDMNANIDLDYSGTSAALNVAQASTGAAAQFTGAKVLIGADTSNANALSAGELYVQGDLEVDGTIYGDMDTSGARTFGATTLDSLTVTGTSDLQGNVSDSAGDFTIADNLAVTGTADLQGNVSDSAGTYTIADDIDITPAALTSGGTDDYALSISQTLNDAEAAGGSDEYRGIKLNVTETDKTGWDNVYLMDLQVGGTSEFLIADSGNITTGGTLNMSSNKITSLGTPTADTDAATKAYADSITPATAGGWTDANPHVYATTASDNVGIGTTSTGTYKLNVSGATNTTSLYINGALVSSTDLSDTASLAMLGQNETITGNWVNTDNPWADNEVVDALTVSGGTIENTVIGATTPAAATFTQITMNDGLATDTLTYDSTAGYPFNFSDKVSVQDIEIRGASPAVLSFGQGANKTSLIYDPATDEIRFSQGTFAQDFRNMVKNGSFESFSAMQQFHDYDPNYATTSSFGGTWNTVAGYQGGWDNFSPDDWDYVSGKVFQHAPAFFETGFSATGIIASTYEEDFTQGQSAVRLEYNAAAAAGPPDLRPGKISQVIKGLKPSSVYSVGIKMRVEFTLDAELNKIPAGTAQIDIEGEDGGNTNAADNTTTTLSSTLDDTEQIVKAADVTVFPPFGTIVVDSEHIRYEGLDATTTPQRFLKCTRAANGTTASAHNTTGVDITLAPFQKVTNSTAVEFTKFEGYFATDPKASDVTIVLSAEAGSAYFDTMQVVAGGTVPEYTPNTVVDTGDQTIYGSLRIGRASDDRGGILSVDKFVRTRGLELFNDDPGLSGALGGGGMTMGGGGVFPPYEGCNETSWQPATVTLSAMGTYATTAPPYRSYKVEIDGNGTGTGGVDTFAWYYNDDTTQWIDTLGGSLVDCSTTEITLNDGVQVKFSSTTLGTLDDTWWFSASNEHTPMQGTSYAATTSYTPGKIRIYVEPDSFSAYFNQLVFEDGTTKVSLSELASTVARASSITFPSPVGLNSGGIGMNISGQYTPPDTANRTYRIKIDQLGNPTGTPPSSDKFKWNNGDVDGVGAFIWYGPVEIGELMQHFLDNGLYASFWENFYTPDGYITGGIVGDEWTFNATAAGTASIVAHAHSNADTGGDLATTGTTATSFSIGKDTDAAANDISLKFGSAVSEKIIKWDQVNARFNVGGHMNIGGTLTADSITGVADASHTHAGADLPATVSYLSNTIESSEITNETIINEDIALDAAIGWSKISKIGAVASDVGAEPTLTKGNLTESTSSVLTIGSGTGAVIGSGTTIQVKEASGTQNGYLSSTDWTTFNNKVSVEADPLALLTAGTDNVKDTHIDWGLGAGQVSTTDMTEGTNLYYTDGRVDTQLDTNQTIGGTWTFSNQVTVPQTPTNATDAASKSYVDTGIAGLSWKEAVLDYITDNTLVPPTEVSGDRYVLATDGGVPHANWDGAEAGDMVDFNGTSWVEEDPQDGDAVFVEDVDTGYVYTGTVWTPFTGASAYSWGDGLSNSATTVNVGAGTGIDVDANSVIHEDMSTQTSVDNSLGTVIQDVTMGDLGHVTGLTSVDLDGRYYTETEADTNYVNVSGDTTTGTLTLSPVSGYALVTTAGNVGIGTTAPGGLLQVGDATNKVVISSAGAMSFAGTGDIDLPNDSVDTTDVNFNYVTSVATSSPLSGGAVGSEGTAISLSIADAAADGATKGAATFTAADFNATTGNISIDYANAQAASAAAKGFLTSADWTTFNNKQSALTFSTGLTNTNGTITTNDAQIDHDVLLHFVANEHIDWTSASSNFSTAGTGTFAPAVAITSAGSDDKLISLTQTLNDTSAAAETQTYTGIKYVLTSTDVTGWDTVNLMDLHAGATPASKFKVDNSGNLTMAGSATVSGGTIDLGVGVHDDLTATDITDLTDGEATALHIHTGLAPGAHATTHHTGGADEVYWASLEKSSGATTTISSEIDTDITTHADLTATHGATGAVVGTTNTQTLTNKTFSDGVNLATVSGNVGIGTTAPTRLLDVNGALITTSLEVRGASPATITFGSGTSSRNLQFDPATGEFEFSGGKLKQQFYNIIRNGSFEAAQAVGWQMAAGTYGTDVTLVANPDPPAAAIAKFGSKVISMSDTSAVQAIGSKFYLKNDDLDRLKGNKATISTWARTNAGTQGRAAIAITDGVTTEVQNIPADANPQTYLTTTWQQFIYTFDVSVAATELAIFVYAAKDTGDNTAMAVGTKTNDDDAAVTAIYYDGVTLVEGAMALDYGPSPIVDTGSQVIYGSLAIGANYNPYSTDASNYYDAPRLIFGQPDSYFGGGYGGYSGGSGEIRFMKWDSSSAGMFMFNRGIWLRDDYSSTYGATLRVGDSPSSDYANSRGDAYIKGRLELDGYPSGASASSPTLIVGDPTNAGQSINFADGGNYTRMGDVYISDRLEVDGGIYGNGANITNVSATNVSGSFSSIYSTGDVTINQNSVVTDDVYFAVQHNTSNVFAVDKDGDVTIGGNLQVDGTQTILNVETVEVESSSIVMNRNVTSNPSLNASIIANRGTTAGVDRDLRWNESSDVWDLTPDGTNYYAILHSNSSSGGDVSGAFGNLQLAGNSVGAAELASTAIQSGDIEAGDLPGAIVATKIADGSVTNAEFQYLGSVTSDIQSQLSGKQATITGAATSIDAENLTVSRALVSDASGKVAVSLVTPTELSYLSGVSSAIQTQIDDMSAASDTLTGLVQSTTAGTNYITGGKLGIGISAPTADLTVKGDLSSATTGTLTVTNGSASVTTSVDLTGHFSAGDAIKIVNTAPSESSIYTVSAINATTITLDSTYSGTTDSDGSATAKKDPDLFLVKDGNDVAMMTLDSSGNLTIEGTVNATIEGTSSNANLLDNIDSSSFLRSDVSDSVTTGATLNIDSGATLSIDGTLDLGGTAITPTATEINILSGGLSAAELDSSLLTASEGDTAYVNVSGDTMTGSLTMTSADISIDAGQKINVEGSTGDTYMKFNATTNKLEVYVNDAVVAYFRN